MIHREVSSLLKAALADTPVLFLQGARQVGKSTLARSLLGDGPSVRYVTLDDPTVRAAAGNDPQGFVDSSQGTLIIDEVQRAPELLLSIKQRVDRDRRPGQFVLTGSANVLLMPKIAESLVGRVEIQTLWPFSQRELHAPRHPHSRAPARPDNFVDEIFAEAFADRDLPPLTRNQMIAGVMRGGYPEACARTDPARRAAWFTSYLSTILDRDVRELANIEQLGRLPGLLSLLAARSSQLLNTASISRASGIPNVTLHRYLTLLQTTFLLMQVRPWSTDLGLRWVRSPKLYMVDTGLACHLLGLSEDRLRSDPVLLGPVFENFVVMELQKLRGTASARSQQFHFRAHTGHEVDIVLESPDGRCVGIEVKASATVGRDDLAGLTLLREKLGDRFVRGIVLYLGQTATSAGKNLHVVPVSRLWG